MKKISVLALASIFALAACKSDKKEQETEVNQEQVEQTKTSTTESNTASDTEERKKVKVKLEAKSDSGTKGNVVFTQEKGIVTMVAVLSGLTPGEHAIHIHEKADCTANDGTSAGGHWNPTKVQHGKWGDSEGYHKGDIGNFTANEKGQGTITHITDEWCIGCGDPNKDILGKAVIVHQGSDDFTSQPTGNAGGRVSCGGIIE